MSALLLVLIRTWKRLYICLLCGRGPLFRENSPMRRTHFIGRFTIKVHRMRPLETLKFWRGLGPQEVGACYVHVCLSLFFCARLQAKWFDLQKCHQGWGDDGHGMTFSAGGNVVGWGLEFFFLGWGQNFPLWNARDNFQTPTSRKRCIPEPNDQICEQTTPVARQQDSS